MMTKLLGTKDGVRIERFLTASEKGKTMTYVIESKGCDNLIFATWNNRRSVLVLDHGCEDVVPLPNESAMEALRREFPQAVIRQLPTA